MTRKLNVDEWVYIRNPQTIINGAKTPNGKRTLYQILMKLVENLEEVYLLEIYKVSPRKYQLCMVNTKENTYNVEDDNIYFTANGYNISLLNNVREVIYYNSFFGEQKELRPVCEEIKVEYGEKLSGK